ncbi:hypothetical protein SAMN05216559_3528 [Halomicrobium zhouii]|uniref:C2H2-type domain-containing protein n=1 Tax=Halomicrobium zhouii TaxID=767519 RepID=A0A1I6LZK9_9EURY|nr:C2H2-type zinc finger protein [Halomicrobium zhouii]SFS08845.1 hypothetical protein SAMN05216559_3528 [Halomicrobium zhouii]
MTETVTDREPDASDRSAEEYELRTDLPVYECEHCGRPFARESWLALHRGQSHPGDLDDDEIAAFREAHADEEADLRRFRLKALGTLVLLYFALLMVYAVV